ncbi:hypothetical protein NKR19_g5144 [Coniochaeta hoffmannii]|uniref:F-box domain-containing protein n=1 Tax=Coniochaeta hoffmannii TaxID=91930 RepID=A0AA38VM09_9PEZI|nr:hypothetical protein NKR19_g5144 [Coniochaeta hoffmannii]
MWHGQIRPTTTGELRRLFFDLKDLNHAIGPSLLPNEIISAVLSELDIGSVLSFRKVDSLARAIVSKLTEFRVVTIHARPCLVAVI